MLSIDALGNRIISNYVISKTVDSQMAADCSHTKFITPEIPLDGYAFFRWAARTAQEVIASSRDQSSGNWIITEIGVGYSLLILRLRLRTRAKLVVQLVMTCVTCFNERGWLKDRYSQPLDWRQRIYFFRLWYFRVITSRWFARAADGVIGNSALNIEELGLNCAKPTSVIPNCVTIPPQKAVSSGDDTATKLTLIFVGAMWPTKGVGFALKTVEQLVADGVDIELHLIGRIPKQNRKWFKRLLRRYNHIDGRIKYLGFLTASNFTQPTSLRMLCFFHHILKARPGSFLKPSPIDVLSLHPTFPVRA